MKEIVRVMQVAHAQLRELDVSEWPLRIQEQIAAARTDNTNE